MSKPSDIIKALNQKLAAQDGNDSGAQGGSRDRVSPGGWRAAPPASKCDACSKTVYATEKVSTGGAIYHRTCFKCVHCNVTLNINRYATEGGQVYCQRDYDALFRVKTTRDSVTAEPTPAPTGEPTVTEETGDKPVRHQAPAQEVLEEKEVGTTDTVAPEEATTRPPPTPSATTESRETKGAGDADTGDRSETKANGSEPVKKRAPPPVPAKPTVVGGKMTSAQSRGTDTEPVETDSARDTPMTDPAAGSSSDTDSDSDSESEAPGSDIPDDNDISEPVEISPSTERAVPPRGGTETRERFDSSAVIESIKRGKPPRASVLRRLSDAECVPVIPRRRGFSDRTQRPGAALTKADDPEMPGEPAVALLPPSRLRKSTVVGIEYAPPPPPPQISVLPPPPSEADESVTVTESGETATPEPVKRVPPPLPPRRHRPRSVSPGAMEVTKIQVSLNENDTSPVKDSGTPPKRRQTRGRRPSSAQDRPMSMSVLPEHTRALAMSASSAALGLMPIGVPTTSIVESLNPVVASGRRSRSRAGAQSDERSDAIEIATSSVWSTPAGLAAFRRSPAATYAGKQIEMKLKPAADIMTVYKNMVWAGNSERVKSWDARTGATRKKFKTKSGQVTALAGIDGYMWTGHAEGRVCVLEGETGKILAKHEFHGSEVQFIVQTQPKLVMVLYSDHTVIIISTARKREGVYERRTILPSTPLVLCTVDNDLWTVSISSLDVYVPDLSERKICKQVPTEQTGRVTGIAHANTWVVCTVHESGVLATWSAGDATLLKLFRMRNISIVQCVVTREQYVWCGGADGRVKVFDLETQCLMKEWSAHNSNVCTLAASETVVTSSSSEGNIRCWDAILKEDWVDRQMELREEEYATTSNLKVFIGTWNVNAHVTTKDLDVWIGGADDLQDMYVLVFQEVVELTTQNVAFSDGKNFRMWEVELAKAFHELCANTDKRYTLLHSSNLVGIALFVFVENKHVRNIRDVQESCVKLGFGGISGNKGALAVSFFYGNSLLCFIGAHIAAGQKHTELRNENHRTVMRDLEFGGGKRKIGPSAAEHDAVFFAGDLNYRVDYDYDECKALVFQKNWKTLLSRDQLTQVRNRGDAWEGFDEGAIDFAPTYKYDPGTNIYDTSAKRRSPAWCDRVLYRGPAVVEQLSYARHELLDSDHRPVSAVFLVETKQYESARKRAVHQEVLKMWNDATKQAIAQARR